MTDKYGETKAKLLAIYSPDKTAPQMAQEIGKGPAYVRAALRRLKLTSRRAGERISRDDATGKPTGEIAA